MPHEDLEIRITRDGRILVKTSATGEMAINDLRRFLEEAVGPIQAEGLMLDRDDDEAMARLRAERSAGATEGLDQAQSATDEIRGTIG
jgi:hypothetical protein